MASLSATRRFSLPLAGGGRVKVPGFPPRSRQRGAVLLLAVFVLVIGSSFMLLQGLNASAGTLRAYRQQYDAEVLAHAKAALLGYAAAYPELVGPPPEKGPGYLPCPDRNNDNIPDGNCSAGGETNIGRLPWRYLGLEDIRDSAGERLWYAVGDNHNYGPTPRVVNSETGGNLMVDGQGDVVAVIFAPLANSVGQNRPSNNQSDYLDGENGETGGAYDQVFTSQSADDQVIAITRTELMAVVEKRVAGEFANALERYRADPDQDASTIATHYPWLCPFENPKKANKHFDAQVDQREGHCPCDKDGNDFAADALALGWTIPAGGTYTPSGAPAPSDTCLRSNIPCDDKNCTYTLPATVNGTCKWSNRNTVGCSILNIDVPGVPILPATSCLTRTFSADISYEVDTANGTVDVNSGTPTDVRRRDVTRNLGVVGPVDLSITLADSDGTSAELEITGSTAGTFNVAGIPYGMDTHLYPAPDPGPDLRELPAWIAENEWHHLTYLAYALGDQPLPGDTVLCTPGADCLTYNAPGVAGNDIRALVVAAGQALTLDTPQDRLPTAADSLTNFFEGANATASDSFEARPWGADFNDQSRRVLPDPYP